MAVGWASGRRLDTHPFSVPWSLPSAPEGDTVNGSWFVPGRVFEDFEGEATDCYYYFVWLWQRKLLWKQSRIQWPLERQTHYVASDRRKRIKEMQR